MRKHTKHAKFKLGCSTPLTLTPGGSGGEGLKKRRRKEGVEKKIRPRDPGPTAFKLKLSGFNLT